MNRLRLTMPLLFCIVLISGVYLPLYSDEIVTKFNVARFFLENGQMVSFFPQCASSVGHAVSWVFYPAAILISAVYAHLEPLGIRISGIVLALVWFILLAWWCYRQSPLEWVTRFTLLAAFGALGIVPYLWVMSRPEQFMLLPIMFFCIAGLYAYQLKGAFKQAAMAVLLVVLLSIFFYAHPKSLFFAPFFMVAAWMATRSFPSIVRSALVVYVVALAVQALIDANTLGACADAPAVQAILSSNIVRPDLLLSDPAKFFNVLGTNLLQFFPRVMRHLAFSSTFQSGWLPPLSQQPGYLGVLNVAIKLFLCLFIALSHLAALVAAYVALRSRQLSIPLVLAGLLAGADLINVLLYNVQNFYAGTQYVPISMIITLLLFQHLPTYSFASIVRKREPLIATVVAALSVISMATLLFLVTPNLVRSADFPQASLPGQPLSIPVLNTRAHQDSIRELGKLCNIPEQSAEFLVVDHMTYFAYLKNRDPIHVLYVSELAYGGDLKGGKLLPFLKKHNSPGLIARCEWVPDEMRSRQKQDDRGYCCVNFSD